MRAFFFKHQPRNFVALKELTSKIIFGKTHSTGTGIYRYQLAGYPAIFSIRYPAKYPASQIRCPA
jgi:hypothetical protein